MTRETITDAATFAGIVAGAFVARNAFVIAGLSGMLIYGLFSA